MVMAAAVELAARLPQHPGQVNADEILTRAGFEIRGNRAACPYCKGRSRLTVAIRGELFFCHRCHRGGHVRTLAREQGIDLGPYRRKAANVPKAEFRAWLSRTMTVLAEEERRAYKTKRAAEAALKFYPDFEPALKFLRWFYVRHRVWERFWRMASDRIGRYWLYRGWRRRHHDAK